MLVTQKCQYALRASFELARRAGRGPTKIAEIAEIQAIPTSFLEVILGQLKQGGFVASQRGSDGGYQLVKEPAAITVGQIVRFMQGPIGPIGCVADPDDDQCPLYGDCAFYPMWDRVRRAIAEVYDGTTLQDLVDQDNQRRAKRNADPKTYSISDDFAHRTKAARPPRQHGLNRAPAAGSGPR